MDCGGSPLKVSQDTAEANESNEVPMSAATNELEAEIERTPHSHTSVITSSVFVEVAVLTINGVVLFGPELLERGFCVSVLKGQVLECLGDGYEDLLLTLVEGARILEDVDVLDGSETIVLTAMVENWPKSAGDLMFDKLLGQGFFGEVWSCRFRANSSRTPIAVKKVALSLLRQHHLTEQMEREISILQKLDHPHIVKLHCNFHDDTHVYMAMEFAEGGTMFDCVGKITLEESAKYFYETCDALEYLHTLPERVIHRDIKPENVLFDKDQHVKLVDFGWSNMMQGLDSRATFCGTLDFLAPEMIRGEGHNESLDMWEMGVLLFEMITGQAAFSARTQEQTCRLILRCNFRFPADMDTDAKDCIQSLCKINPAERLTAKKTKEHFFVRKYHLGLPTAVIGPAA
jgi:hypothetical protein